VRSQQRALEPLHSIEDKPTHASQRQVAKGRRNVTSGPRAVDLLDAGLKLTNTEPPLCVMSLQCPNRALTLDIRESKRRSGGSA
jgi:hypothetical protein